MLYTSYSWAQASTHSEGLVGPRADSHTLINCLCADFITKIFYTDKVMVNVKFGK